MFFPGREAILRGVQFDGSPLKSGTSRFVLALLCLSFGLSIPAKAQPASKAAGTATAASRAPAPGSAPVSAAEKAAQASLARAKTAYQAGQYKEAETGLNRLLKTASKTTAAEEAMVLLADAQLRQNRADQAIATITRFHRAYTASPHGARMDYYQGLASLKLGRNGESAKSLAMAAGGARIQSLRESAAKGLRHICDGGGLSAEELEASIELLDRDKPLQAEMTERLGDLHMREGKYQAAKTVFGDWLERFDGLEGESRIKEKRRQAEEAPRLSKVLLLMAPMSGEFGEIGRSLREGALLAVEEHNQKGGPRVDTRVLDDQGNMIVGIHRLRKSLREEKIDAIIGPAMSDVSAAAAVDLSARKSPIPLITPTATTHGIAALGEGIFQLNVTTGTLGQKIASFAVSCLKLKDFAIVAPETEYGYQLADAFQKAVERKGGTVISVQYFVPGSTDLGPQFQEVRKAAMKLWLEKRKAEGIPEPESKDFQKFVSDTTIPIDGIFLPATNGEEANQLAGSFSFSRMKGQILGSSGWNDKALLHKSGTAFQGAYFSVDFQENLKSEGYLAFQRGFSARWKRSPDKVAGLAYDAARFVLQGMQANMGEGQLIPGLRTIRSINGVMGKIVFDEKYGANANAAIYKVEKRGFKETEACPEAE